MDSSSSSLAQQHWQPHMQLNDNTSREFEMQPETLQADNTCLQLQVQSTMEMPKNTSQQSQMQPETTYIAELQAKISSLQAELELLKSKPNLYELICENQLLKVDLANANECIQILARQVEEKDQEQEKEIDRKGKKKVEKVKSVICFTKKGTNEVISAMPISDSSDDSDGGGETDDEDEENVLAHLKALENMKMLGRVVGSSSKTGSGFESDCVLSNGEVEKSIMTREHNKRVKDPLLSENDLIPKHLNVHCRPNYKEVSKLAGSSETGSSSCQTGLPPDEMKSKSTTDTTEMMELNDGETGSTPRKRKWDVYWGSEEDMLCSLTSKPEMLLEAVCALYRLERERRLCSLRKAPWALYKGLSDSDYKRLMYVTNILTEGNMLGPTKKTKEELEVYLKGSIDFIGRLVGTYSTLLYQIYCRGSDLHFC